MRIGVDFDDVLFPYHHHLKERIRRRWGVDLKSQRMTSFYYEDHPLLRARGVTRPQMWTEVRETWKEVETHERSGLLDPEAPRVLRELQLRHTVDLISARSEEALPQVELFLRRHDIHPRKILLGRHVKNGFDVLIDDYPEHAQQNAASGGHSLLYTIDENSNFDESRHPRIVRVHGWNDVAAVIRRLEARGPPRA